MSAFINLFLMTSLNSATWVRFSIWFAIGFVLYFGYGIRNSHENKKGSHQNWLFPCIEKNYANMDDSDTISVIPAIATASGGANDNESTV